MGEDDGVGNVSGVPAGCSCNSSYCILSMHYIISFFQVFVIPRCVMADCPLWV